MVCSTLLIPSLTSKALISISVDQTEVHKDNGSGFNSLNMSCC